MMQIEKGTARLRADFNSVRDGETLVATFAFNGGYVLPDVGELVEVFDPEGNVCLGDVVERLDDDSFRVRLDYATWQDAPDEPVIAPVTDLMDALRRSLVEAHARGVETGPEREEVDDFTISAA
jgi:hypothetical protein